MAWGWKGSSGDVEKNQKKGKEDGKKGALEGMSSLTNNSFSALDNEVIADLARDMGVNILEENFDVIDMMKDLECARHAMEKVKNKKIPISSEEIPPENEKEVSEIPLLEWLEADSES
jgi:hypothetical protein